MQASIFLRMAPYLHLTFGQGSVCDQPALELGERSLQLGRGFLSRTPTRPRARRRRPRGSLLASTSALARPPHRATRAAASAGSLTRRSKRTRLSNSALTVTVTVEALIASADHSGLSRTPSDGYKAPAATGIATTL